MGASQIQALTDLLLEFRRERDWEQFHNPKDQALSLSLEVAELLEHMQWKNGKELTDHLNAVKPQVTDELADVLGWVLLIANDLGIDLDAAVRHKVQKNCEKYPIDKAKGKATKYDKL
ncbi:nucleotide pyrophosphohydrolase [soil metagenome]